MSAEAEDFDEEEIEDAPPEAMSKRAISEAAEAAFYEEFYRREYWGEQEKYHALHPHLDLSKYSKPRPGFDPGPADRDLDRWWSIEEKPTTLPPLTDAEMGEWIDWHFCGGARQALLDWPTQEEAATWVRRRCNPDGFYSKVGGFSHNKVPKRSAYAVVLWLIPEDGNLRPVSYTDRVTSYGVPVRGAWVTFDQIARHIRAARSVAPPVARVDDAEEGPRVQLSLFAEATP